MTSALIDVVLVTDYIYAVEFKLTSGYHSDLIDRYFYSG